MHLHKFSILIERSKAVKITSPSYNRRLRVGWKKRTLLLLEVDRKARVYE